MAIRSDMVEAAGLTVDDFKDTTWSQFEELAKNVVEANGVPMISFLRGIRNYLWKCCSRQEPHQLLTERFIFADNEAD